MASQNDSGFRSFLASGAISAYIVVNVQSDGTITAAANNVKGIGVLQEDAADANYASVKLWTAPGTFMAAVSGTAVTIGTALQVITGGYIGASTGTNRVVPLSSAVASNGVVVEFAQA